MVSSAALSVAGETLYIHTHRERERETERERERGETKGGRKMNSTHHLTQVPQLTGREC